MGDAASHPSKRAHVKGIGMTLVTVASFFADFSERSIIGVSGGKNGKLWQIILLALMLIILPHGLWL
jgi:hypothetical protein